MSDRLTTGPGPFFVRSTSEFNPKQGWEVTEFWEGSENECRAKQAQFISLGASRVALEPKTDGNWQVRAMFSNNPAAPDISPFVDTMELEVNAVMRAPYQSPVYRARFSDYDAPTQYSARANSTLGPVSDCARKYLSGRPAQEASLLASGAANPNAGKYAWVSPAGVTAYVATRELAIQAELDSRLGTLGLSGSELLSAQRLFVNIAYRGVTGFIEYNTVFRRTVTAGSPAAVTANFTGAGKIWTTAEVISFEGIPNDGWFVLPPGSQWHKDKPRVLSVYGQKTQLTYSYTEIATASALFYQAKGSAALIDT